MLSAFAVGACIGIARAALNAPLSAPHFKRRWRLPCGAIVGSALARPYPYAYYGPAPVYYYGPAPYYGCWRWRNGYRYRVC